MEIDGIVFYLWRGVERIRDHAFCSFRLCARSSLMRLIGYDLFCFILLFSLHQLSHLDSEYYYNQSAHKEEYIQPFHPHSHFFSCIVLVPNLCSV